MRLILDEEGDTEIDPFLVIHSGGKLVIRIPNASTICVDPIES